MVPGVSQSAFMEAAICAKTKCPIARLLNATIVGIILGIYAASALAAGDPGWGWRGRWNIYATAALFGLAWATLMEHAPLAAGSWSYSEGMPIVPWLRAGLWPLLQMTLLPPLTFWIARWWAGRSATQRKGIYDES